MALADYRLCDVCGGKAFYDANLNYRKPEDEAAVLCAGEPVPYFDCALDSLGDWAVLCRDCAKTHRTAVVQLPQETADG